MSGLPPTLAAVMQSNRSTGLRTERDEVKVIQGVPYIVTGGQTLSITIRRKDLSESARPASSSATGGTSSTASDSSSDAPGTDGPSPMSSGLGEEEDAGSPIMFDSQPKSAPKAAPATTTSTAASGAPDSPPAPNNGGVGTGAAGDEADTGTATASSDTTVKPVGRLPQVWRQGAMSDFAAGTLKSVAVTSLGDVRLAPSLQKVADTTEKLYLGDGPGRQGQPVFGDGRCRHHLQDGRSRQSRAVLQNG